MNNKIIEIDTEGLEVDSSIGEIIINAELSELLGVSRVSVARWRRGQRYLKFDEIVEYEEKLEFPFECFISRDSNLEAIKDKLEAQLKAVKIY